MDLKKLEEFIALAKKTGVSKLKYQSDDEEYSVEIPFATAIPATQFTHQHYQQHAHLAPIANPTTEPIEGAPKKGLKEITSPFVGTFYRSPSPNAPFFVNVGDKIGPGKTLCIVEAMKIMNEIESDLSGEIVEICVENGSYVEYGQVLMRLK